MYESLNIDLLYVFTTVAELKVSIKVVMFYYCLSQPSVKRSSNWKIILVKSYSFALPAEWH